MPSVTMMNGTDRMVRTGFRKKFTSVNASPAASSAHPSLP